MAAAPGPESRGREAGLPLLRSLVPLPREHILKIIFSPRPLPRRMAFMLAWFYIFDTIQKARAQGRA